jgi:hypothetical protein
VQARTVMVAAAERIGDSGNPMQVATAAADFLRPTLSPYNMAKDIRTIG